MIGKNAKTGYATELACGEPEIAALQAQNHILIAQVEALRKALMKSQDELVRLSLLLSTSENEVKTETNETVE